MTGTKVGPSPWKSLAAEIINRARADWRGAIGSGISNNLIKALLQYDAECWLEHDPWCQNLLDCILPMEYDVPQSCIVAKEHRWQNYYKYLPQDIDINAQIPMRDWGGITGLDLDRKYLNKLAREGCIEATQSHRYGIWSTNMSEIAKVVAMGRVNPRVCEKCGKRRGKGSKCLCDSCQESYDGIYNQEYYHRTIIHVAKACIDCGKPITLRAIRCNSCAAKERLK